jgi:hypothetical protein
MMFRYPFLVAAALVMAAAVAATTSQAIADAPCGQPPCAVRRPVVVYRSYDVPRYFIVDRGPVYRGPGIYANPTVVWRERLPRYPYVGRIYPGL